MSTLPFANFTKGEISPELQARIDTNQYEAGAKKVRNFIIQRYGGLSFRPGFRLVGEVDVPTEKIRYVPFQYNIEQAYIMSLENDRMRLLAGGGMISEEDVQITAITKSVNGQITAPFHGYAVGDRIFLSGIVGMTELNARFVRVVSIVDPDRFTIDVNTTTYNTFVSSAGSLRVGAPPAPPAVPPPLPAPPAQPADPVVSGGGGSGSEVGETEPRFRYDYSSPYEVEP